MTRGRYKPLVQHFQFYNQFEQKYFLSFSLLVLLESESGFQFLQQLVLLVLNYKLVPTKDTIPIMISICASIKTNLAFICPEANEFYAKIRRVLVLNSEKYIGKYIIILTWISGHFRFNHQPVRL